MSKKINPELPGSGTNEEFFNFITLPPEVAVLLFHQEEHDQLPEIKIREEGTEYCNAPEDVYLELTRDADALDLDSVHLFYQYSTKRVFVYATRTGRVYASSGLLHSLEIAQHLKSREATKIIK